MLEPMSEAEQDEALERIRAALRGHSGLRLLVLHGSRARGDMHASSDWDFAYLAESSLDPGSLYADLALALHTDHVDIANLDTAGSLLRYRVARDGLVVHEIEPGLFDRFWFDAVSFWCDAGPILAKGYETVLRGLGA
jgi:predicted nucleotidyltransferase